MLTNTFIHIPGVGPYTERHLWSQGITSWNNCLSSIVSIDWTGGDYIAPFIRESLSRLARGDASYFQYQLPTSERWRIYREFRDRTAFLDIETTGMAPPFAHVTMVGLYNGKEYRAYIRGVNLHLLNDELSRYRLLITYNGASFDLPFMQTDLGMSFSHHAHIDLRYPLRRLGYYGGLKHIEQALGMTRPPGIDGLDGYDAVRLWFMYQNGSKKALETLVRYNAEDVLSLPALMDLVYNTLTRQVPFHVEPLQPLRRPQLELPYDPNLAYYLKAKAY